MSLDLRALGHFVAITRQGGFARAARDLNVSQPTLSRSIAQLEEQLGARLFARSTRGTQISPEGARFLPHAIAIISEVDRAQSLFDLPSAEMFEQVRLGLSPNFIHPPFIDVVGGFLAEHRKVNVAVQTGTMEQLMVSVRSREIDVAVCLLAAYLAHNSQEFDGCLFEELASETVFPIARVDHPVFDQAATLEAMSAHKWAVPFQLSVSYRFETAFYRRNLPIPQQRLNCSSMALLRRAVVDWGLIAMVPAQSFQTELSDGRVRRLHIAELEFPYTITLITSRIAQPSASSAALIHHIRDALTAS